MFSSPRKPSLFHVSHKKEKQKNVFKSKKGQKHYETLRKLVEEKGLSGLYDNLDDYGIGTDIFLSVDDLLHLASFDKNFQTENHAQTFNITKEKTLTTKHQSHFKTCFNPFSHENRHDDVKERNGRGMIYIEDEAFLSWEGSIQNNPAIIFTPQTIAGLQSLVHWAQKKDLRIRASGYRHSSSAVYADDNQILLAMVDIKTATRLPARHPEMDPKNDMQGIQLVGQPYLKDGKEKIQCKIGASTCNYHLQDWLHDSQGRKSAMDFTYECHYDGDFFGWE